MSRRALHAGACLLICGVASILPGCGPGSGPPAVDLAGADPAVVQAIEAAGRRVQEAPSSPEAWGNLGMTLLAHDHFAAAGQSLARAESLDAKDPRWPYLRAQALLKGEPDAGQAAALLERAALLAGNEPAPRLRLGELHLEHGRLDQAEEAFRLAAGRQPGNARALLGLGRAAYARGNLPEALRLLSASALAAPQVKGTHALLAEIQFRSGNRDASERERKLLRGLPDVPFWPDTYQAQVTRRWVGVTSFIEQAEALMQGNRGEEAVALLQRSLETHPHAHLLRMQLGRMLIQLRRFQEAEAVLGAAAQEAPDSFEAHIELGNALVHQNKIVQAMESYRRTIAIKPGWGPAHYFLAKCLINQGDRPGALEEFRANIRYQPDHASGQRDLGILLAGMGRIDEAVVHLENAVRLNPGDGEAAELLKKIGK